MNNDDGALHLDLTISDKQFQGALEENLRRVKGFSNATAAEGMKIEKAVGPKDCDFQGADSCY